MAEGYCVKCKAKREIANGVEETMKNGRKAIKGKCPTCGTVMFKILGGKAAPAAPAAPPRQSADELIMSQQLAYVIVTPYSLYKSRTGGILSRLISRTGLDLAAMRMFAPSAELARQYAEAIVSVEDPQDRKIQELLRDYVLQNLSPDPKTGRRRRVLVMVFRGEDAVRKVRAVVGNLSPDRRSGETIRDTYSDLIMDDDGQTVRYFEPAVLAAPNVQEAEAKLKLWARFSDSDGGILENVIAYPPGQMGERTLVLIKPDNFKFPTGRPGNVIDFFSRTGLYIVGVKVLHMSLAQAMEFYGPVREVLRTKLKEGVSERAKTAAGKGIRLQNSAATQQQALGEILGPLHGDHQFDNIMRFMTGHAPSEVQNGGGTAAARHAKVHRAGL